MTALGHFCPQFDDQIKEKGSGFYAGLGQDEFFKGTVAQDWPMLTLLNSTAHLLTLLITSVILIPSS